MESEFVQAGWLASPNQFLSVKKLDEVASLEDGKAKAREMEYANPVADGGAAAFDGGSSESSLLKSFE